MNDIEKAFIVSVVQASAINFPKQAKEISDLSFKLYDVLFKDNPVDRSQENRMFRLLDAITKIEYHAKLIEELANLIEEEGSLYKLNNIRASCNQIIKVELHDLKCMVKE